MKTALSFNAKKALFQADIGGHRFYLGPDAGVAQHRKVQLHHLWAKAGKEWTPELLAIAGNIRKGEGVRLARQTGEDDAAYLKREAMTVRALPTDVDIVPAITREDLANGVEQLLLQRIATLEQTVRERLGEGAVIGPAVSIHTAIDEFIAYRVSIISDEESARTEANAAKFAKAHIPDVPLTKLTYVEIQRWCRTIANRPISKKYNRPIRRKTVRNVLQAIRRFISWSSHNYGWTRPQEWQEATRVKLNRTLEERREAEKKIEAHYTFEEIETLWRFALPIERMLMLLALNFGFAQAEIRDSEKDDILGHDLRRLRGKEGNVYAQWPVWPETKALAKTQWDLVPKKRQRISDKWTQLLNRVLKDQPDFKKLSFKWLRKSGSSFIRKDVGGEIASMYLSHGEVTDDDLLEDYAAKPWNKLAEAVCKLHEKLAPIFAIPADTRRIHGPKSAVQTIIDGWAAGKKAEEIMAEAKVSRATVYRYKPQPTPDAQDVQQSETVA